MPPEVLPTSQTSIPEPPVFEQCEQPPSRTGLDVLALALLDDDGDLVLGPGAAELAEDLDVDLLQLLEPLAPSARAGELTSLSLPGFLVHVVGVGDAGPTDLRRAGAALGRATRGRQAVASSVQAVAGEEGLTAFVAGAVLGSFTYSLRTSETDPAVARIVLAGGPHVEPAVLQRAEAIARAGWEARRLASVPSKLRS